MLALAALPERTVVLVLPDFTIRTADAVRRGSRRRDPRMSPSPRLVTVPEITSWESLQPHVVNDFEGVVDERHPEVETIIAQLRLAGATIAGMSGSGSTLFGVVPLFADIAKLYERAPGHGGADADGDEGGGGGVGGVIGREE